MSVRQWLDFIRSVVSLLPLPTGGEPNVALVEVPPDGGAPNATEEEGVHNAAEGPPNEEA
jgi:hypothetical protein